MLIRPNGIHSYGLLRAALDGVEIDYGYELIEADWVLDFSAEAIADGPPPVATAAGAGHGSGPATRAR